ncbi:hypothetical protein BGZ79_002788, partial [Entomortierella chlamydospora]
MKTLAGQGSNSRSLSLKTKILVTLIVIIIVSAWTLLSNIDVMDFDVNFENTNSFINGQNDTAPSVDLGPLEPAVSLLDRDTKYLTFLPFAGFTNQFISIEPAALIAKKLNRTLILPPIMSSYHDHDNTHQRWASLFNIPRFTHLTGIPVLAWDQVRPLTPAQRKVGRDQAVYGTYLDLSIQTEEWARVAENLTCEIIVNYGTPGNPINHSGMNFLWHFLFRPIPKQPPMKNEGENGLYVLDDIVTAYADNQDQLLVLSNAYKVRDDAHGSRLWDEIGSNLHFVPELMEYATLRVNEESRGDWGIEALVDDDPEEKPRSPEDEDIEPIIPPNMNPNATESGVTLDLSLSNMTAPLTRTPYIAIHLRRGDIWEKCKGKDMTRCLIPFDTYVDAVARARTNAAARGLHSRLPVIVTTDTTSEDDLRTIEQLGWHRMDHAKYGTAKLWGPFGEAMVDAAVLAHADEFVGSPMSTMTRIAARRQKSWYNRGMIYPGAPKKKGMRKRYLVSSERHANQFMSLQSAGLLAKKLNRTLIIPPIISNFHDHNNTHQRWSRYFDLPKFASLAGVSIVEWDQVRPLTPTQRKAGQDQATLGAQSDLLETDEWARVAENLTCQIIFGYGTSRLGINHSSWNFLWHFLFRPVFKEPPPPVPGMPDLSLAKIKGDPKAGHDLVAVDDIVARYRDNDEQMLMLSDTFKVIDPGYGGSRFWNEIGSHLHFIPQLMDFATSILDKEFQYDQGIEVSPNDDPEEVSPEDSTNKNPITTEPGDLSNAAILNITAPATRIPYIAVHLRRGDIGGKCSKENMYSKCLIPIELYEDAVARARTDAATRGLHSRLPVAVTTDTTSEDDIQKIEQLGWHRIDHSKYGTTELWGAFGEVMVDFAILAHADEFVGSPASTMTWRQQGSTTLVRPTGSRIHTPVSDSGVRLELRDYAALIVKEEMEKNQEITVLPNDDLEEEKGMMEVLSKDELMELSISTNKNPKRKRICRARKPGNIQNRHTQAIRIPIEAILWISDLKW